METYIGGSSEGIHVGRSNEGYISGAGGSFKSGETGGKLGAGSIEWDGYRRDGR